MSNISKIDRNAAKEISAAVEEALQLVADDLGLAVEVNGGKYDPTVGTYSPKITFSIAGAEHREFALLAPQFGLTPDDYGREFKSGGKAFTVVSLRPRSPKYPLIGEDENGRRYKFSNMVLATLANHEAPHQVNR